MVVAWKRGFGKDRFEAQIVDGHWKTPEGMTIVPQFAFHRCEVLETVTIGQSVTSIGFDAFHNSSLATATVSPALTLRGCEFPRGTIVTCVTPTGEVRSSGGRAHTREARVL